MSWRLLLTHLPILPRSLAFSSFRFLSSPFYCIIPSLFSPQAIADILDDENYDDGSVAPLLIRLAWHGSGSYDKATGTGGSNGATIRFEPERGYGANAGVASVCVDVHAGVCLCMCAVCMHVCVRERE